MLVSQILNDYRKVAVVGASPNPERPSYKVTSYLAEHGYHVIPVNPNAQQILGKTSYPNLSSIPETVEVVDIFRRSEEVMPIVEEAIKIKAKAVWMQEGIINEEAASRARDAGLLVVMDKCMLKEHQRLTRIMKVIGLTGGISSGKSTVSQFLAELGAVIIDADKVGHEAFKPDTEVWREVVAAFGKQILTPNGAIDREKLGTIVFGSSEAQARLNQIMHPRMYGTVKAQLEEYRRKAVAVVVLEAPLLLEAGWTSLVDEVWVATASESTVLKRLKERTGLSEKESLTRIRSQLPAKKRVRHADVVIDTDCDFDELKAKVKELWQGLQG